LTDTEHDPVTNERELGGATGGAVIYAEVDLVSVPGDSLPCVDFGRPLRLDDDERVTGVDLDV
jgi:hypothetical protein